MNSRRTFLKQMSGAAIAASAAPSLLSWATVDQGEPIELPGEDGMIVRSFRFVDLETPVEYLNTWLTPVPHFANPATAAQAANERAIGMNWYLNRYVKFEMDYEHTGFRMASATVVPLHSENVLMNRIQLAF